MFIAEIIINGDTCIKKSRVLKYLTQGTAGFALLYTFQHLIMGIYGFSALNTSTLISI